MGVLCFGFAFLGFFFIWSPPINPITPPDAHERHQADIL